MVLLLSMGSQVFGTGFYYISGFSWDKGTVGVGNESSESWGVVWGNWGSWGNEWSSLGGQMFGTGSDNIGWFSWDDGTVGVSYESWGVWVSSVGGVWVSSISVSSPSVSSGVSSSISVPSVGSVWVSSPGWESLGGEVSGFSSNYFWGLSWSYGTIWVADELSAGSSSRSEKSLQLIIPINATIQNQLENQATTFYKSRMNFIFCVNIKSYHEFHVCC